MWAETEKLVSITVLKFFGKRMKMQSLALHKKITSGNI